MIQGGPKGDLKIDLKNMKNLKKTCPNFGERSGPKGVNSFRFEGAHWAKVRRISPTQKNTKKGYEQVRKNTQQKRNNKKKKKV